MGLAGLCSAALRDLGGFYGPLYLAVTCSIRLA